MLNAICNLIAMSIFLITGIILLMRKKRCKLTTGQWVPLIISILIYTFVTFSNTLEHFSISAYFDSSEDLAEIAFSLFFLFFIYSWCKQETIKIILEQKSWLKETLESIADGIMITDNNGNIQQINSAMEKLTGYPKYEVISKKSIEILKFRDKNTGKSTDYNPFENLLFKKNPSSLSLSLILENRDGYSTPINEKASLILNQNNKVIGAVGVFRDTSEYDSMMEQLNHIHKMEAISQLAGGVAHDINNQLGIIIGAIDILNSKFHSEEKKKYLNEVSSILTASNKASDLTSNLLAFSRQGKIFSSPVSLNEIIKDTVIKLHKTIFKIAPIALDLTSDNITINGDSTQLKNAFSNLITNSNEAIINNGEIHISTKKIFLDESWCINSQFDISPGKYVLVSIIDNGCGIPNEIKNRIFEPFFTTKEIGKGVGLGLSAVYGTVISHNGAIEIIDNKDQGTCFNLYFPASE